MYKSTLNLLETEIAIKFIKDTFEKELAKALKLTRVSAPLFVEPESGLNDNLNGYERAVRFDVLTLKKDVEIVQSLAKWKRMALAKYGFEQGTGLYTDMNAIRRDEDLDALHSVYVDQWDWEQVITANDRNVEYLKDTVRKIVSAVADTNDELEKIGQKHIDVNRDVHFITSQELEDLYPNNTSKERETLITQKYKSVFIMQIGDVLKSGKKHDGRAPDYDDWTLNGDIFVWHEGLQFALEISSMGIRVDKPALLAQLAKAQCEDRKYLPFHKALLNDELPLTMGGGIGQSRLCMFLLQKRHVGEVQASIWPQAMREQCEKEGIILL